MEGNEGTKDKKSTPANFQLIFDCQKIINMYEKNRSGEENNIDPYTGAPISPQTYDAAVYMKLAFLKIESDKIKP